jgi:hypothetical protein
VVEVWGFSLYEPAVLRMKAFEQFAGRITLSAS